MFCIIYRSLYCKTDSTEKVVWITTLGYISLTKWTCINKVSICLNNSSVHLAEFSWFYFISQKKIKYVEAVAQKRSEKSWLNNTNERHYQLKTCSLMNLAQVFSCRFFGMVEKWDPVPEPPRPLRSSGPLGPLGPPSKASSSNSLQIAVLTRYGGKARTTPGTPGTLRIHGRTMISYDLWEAWNYLLRRSDTPRLNHYTKLLCYVWQILMRELLIVNFKLPSRLYYKQSTMLKSNKHLSSEREKNSWKQNI